MLLSKEEIMVMAKPAPDILTLEAPYGNIVPWHDLKAVREATGLEQDRATLTGMDQLPPTLEEFEEEIKLRDGHKVTIRITRPKVVPAKGSPLLIFFFGGGWCSGSYLQGVPLTRRAATIFGFVAVTANYRVAPEHPFPTPQFDSYDNLKWIAANARKLKADPSKGFILMGGSAGGQIATVCAQRWTKARQGPKITGLFLNTPYLFDESQLPKKYKNSCYSMHQPEIQGAHVLKPNDLNVLLSYWKPNLKSAWHSPFATTNPAEGIPPVCFQAYGQDPLRDHCFIFEDVLREAGVKTKLYTYPGMPHGFPAFITETPMFVKWMNDLVKGFAFLLGISEGEFEQFLF